MGCPCPAHPLACHGDYRQALWRKACRGTTHTAPFTGAGSCKRAERSLMQQTAEGRVSGCRVPKERPSASRLLRHPWLADLACQSTAAPLTNISVHTDMPRVRTAQFVSCNASQRADSTLTIVLVLLILRGKSPAMLLESSLTAHCWSIDILGILCRHCTSPGFFKQRCGKNMLPPAA